MTEAVVAFLLSVLVLAVFSAPAWAMKLGQFGGLAFVFYTLILIVVWALGKRK